MIPIIIVLSYSIIIIIIIINNCVCVYVCVCVCVCVYFVVPIITSVSSNSACTGGDGSLILTGCRTTTWNVTITGTGFDGITSNNNILTLTNSSVGTTTFTSICNAALPSINAVSGITVICAITSVYIGSTKTITYSNINNAVTTFTVRSGKYNKKENIII